MEAIKKIVVPVDFSDNTARLTAYACFMANTFRAVINFIHVIPTYPVDAMIGGAFVADYQEKVHAALQERMTNLVQDMQEQCPGCSGHVMSGEPVEKIVEFSKDLGADMIVISTHGVKGLEKILLGSVTERVVKRAHCPVLVMNPFR